MKTKFFLICLSLIFIHKVSAQNLIVNGDFSSGNVNFISTNNYCNSSGCLNASGVYDHEYAIGTSPVFFHPSFSGSDHTTGTGNMMIVNGALSSYIVWEQNVTVVAGSTYAFSAWVCSVYTGNPATLEFFINNVSVGTLAAPASLSVWQQFTASWNSGGSPTATITIRSTNTSSTAAQAGMDFGLDDLSLIGPEPPKNCCIGNYCSQSTNALTGSYEVPMNAFNYNFTTKGTGQVLIGYPSCNTAAARLDVTDNTYDTGIRGYSSTSRDHVGVFGQVANTGGDVQSITSIGVLGQTDPISHQNKSAAVAGFCGGSTNYALLPTGQDVAIYGNALSNSGIYAGLFDGDVVINGAAPASPIPNPVGGPGLYGLIVNGNALTTAGAWYLSDKRFKDNIKPLGNVIENIKKLNGYNYTYRITEFKAKNFNAGTQLGLIAQELKEVYPELVKEDKDGYMAVNYIGLIPVMLEAVKAQQQQIDELKALVGTLAGNPAAATITAAIPVNLSDKNIVVLNQNVPNPFAESTVISYNIPSDFTKAQISFTDNNGVIIKTVDVKEKGPGTMNVFASDLSHGTYFYSLIIDGKTISTKKMVKE